MDHSEIIKASLRNDEAEVLGIVSGVLGKKDLAVAIYTSMIAVALSKKPIGVKVLSAIEKSTEAWRYEPLIVGIKKFLEIKICANMMVDEVANDIKADIESFRDSIPKAVK